MYLNNSNTAMKLKCNTRKILHQLPTVAKLVPVMKTTMRCSNQEITDTIGLMI